MTLIVGLREDGRHCEAAGNRREHRSPARSTVRSTGAEERASPEASKLACDSGDHTKRPSGYPALSAGQRPRHTPRRSGDSRWQVQRSVGPRSRTVTSASPIPGSTVPSSDPPTHHRPTSDASESRALVARTRTWSSWRRTCAGERSRVPPQHPADAAPASVSALNNRPCRLARTCPEAPTPREYRQVSEEGRPGVAWPK